MKWLKKASPEEWPRPHSSWGLACRPALLSLQWGVADWPALQSSSWVPSSHVHPSSFLLHTAVEISNHHTCPQVFRYLIQMSSGWHGASDLNGEFFMRQLLSVIGLRSQVSVVDLIAYIPHGIQAPLRSIKWVSNKINWKKKMNQSPVRSCMVPPLSPAKGTSFRLLALWISLSIHSGCFGGLAVAWKPERHDKSQ